MKNILVGTDFSNDAYAALFYATQLLVSKPCTFYVLNVFDELTPLELRNSPLLVGKELLDRLKLESQEKLIATFHKIMMDNRNPHHEIHILSKHGDLVRIMKNSIDTYNIDIVVMGSKGNTGAKERFLGSNTIQVANAISRCSILTVPKQIDFKTLKKIAFVTDFKKGCTEKSILPLLFLGSLTGASIQVMHITEEAILNKEQESKRKLLELCLKDVDHSFHWVEEFDDKAVVIRSFLRKSSIDMLAIVHHKHGFLNRFLHKPVLRNVSIPFLILPHQD